MKTYTEYYNYQINEGFWSWFGRLIKSLFTDDTTPQTKAYTKKSLKMISDDNKKLDKPSQELLAKLNKLNGDEFIKELKTSTDKLVEDKIINEDEAIKYKLTILSIAIRVKNDDKDAKAVKTFKDYFDELSKNNLELAKELVKDLKDTEVPENQKKDDKKEEGNNENLLTVYKNNEKVINEIITKTQIDDFNTDNVIKYANNKTHKITDPKTIYSLILISLGSKLVNDKQQLQTYVETLISKISKQPKQ